MTKGPIRLDVVINYAVPRTGVPAAVSFRKWVAAALDSRIREADLAIRIVGTKEGRALNHHYRGKDYATNVLSFPAEQPPRGTPGPRPLGDVVISLDTANRQAREYGRTLAQELSRYLAHGVLHLLGHDHELGVKQARAMAALEARLLGEPGMLEDEAE